MQRSAHPSGFVMAHGARLAWVPSAVLLAVLAGSALAKDGPVSAPTFSPSQEAALLTGSRMVTASERCDGLTIDDDRLTAMLRASGISERDMYLKQRSAALKKEVRAYAESFKGHKDEVCAAAAAEGRANHLLR